MVAYHQLLFLARESSLQGQEIALCRLWDGVTVDEVKSASVRRNTASRIDGLTAKAWENMSVNMPVLLNNIFILKGKYRTP